MFLQGLLCCTLLFCLVVFLDLGGEKQKKKVQYCYSPDLLLRKQAFDIEIRLERICCEKGVCGIPSKGSASLFVTARQAPNPVQAGDAEGGGGERLLQLSFGLVHFAEVVVDFESLLFHEVNKYRCKRLLCP